MLNADRDQLSNIYIYGPNDREKTVSDLEIQLWAMKTLIKQRTHDPFNLSK